MATYDDQPEHENETVGDVSEPAPPSRDAGFMEYFRDPPWRWPEQPAPSHRFISREERDGGAIIERFRDALGENRKDLIEYGEFGQGWIGDYTLPADVRLKPVISGRNIFFDFVDAPNHYTYENMLSGFVPVPEHENTFVQWIEAALREMLAYQYARGWQKRSK